MFTLPTQPQSIGKNLDSGIKLYMAGLVRILPLMIFAAIVGITPDLLGITAPTAGGAAMPLSTIIFLIGYVIVAIIIGLIVYGAVLHQYGSLTTNNTLAVMDSVKHGLNCAPRMFLAAILYSIIFLVGCLLLLIPGIIVMLSLSLFGAAIILDNKKAIDSLKYSHSLIWGNWWRTATIFTVPTIIMIGLYSILATVLGVSIVSAGADAIMTESMNQKLMLFNVIVAMINAVIAPLLYAVTIVVYHDLKLRVSGSDLEAKLA